MPNSARVGENHRMIMMFLCENSLRLRATHPRHQNVMKLVRDRPGDVTGPGAAFNNGTGRMATAGFYTTGAVDDCLGCLF